MGSKEYKKWLKLQLKVGLLRSKQCPNTSQTNPKQLWKSPENDFFDPEIGQKWPLKTAKVGKIVTENIDFWDHLSNFGAENTTTIRPFMAKNIT